jgi:hypothetical protein
VGFNVDFFVEVNIEMKVAIIHAINQPFGLFRARIGDDQYSKFHFGQGLVGIICNLLKLQTFKFIA